MLLTDCSSHLAGVVTLEESTIINDPNERWSANTRPLSELITGRILEFLNLTHREGVIEKERPVLECHCKLFHHFQLTERKGVKETFLSSNNIYRLKADASKGSYLNNREGGPKDPLSRAPLANAVLVRSSRIFHISLTVL